MAAVRTLLAAVLGIGIGILLIAYSETVIRVQTAGRIPSDRNGEYGSEVPISDRWRRVVQFFGGTSLVLGLYFAVNAITGL
jgi:hypothetical protein